MKPFQRFTVCGLLATAWWLTASKLREETKPIPASEVSKEAVPTGPWKSPRHGQADRDQAIRRHQSRELSAATGSAGLPGLREAVRSGDVSALLENTLTVGQGEFGEAWTLLGALPDSSIVHALRLRVASQGSTCEGIGAVLAEIRNSVPAGENRNELIGMAFHGGTSMEELAKALEMLTDPSEREAAETGLAGSISSRSNINPLTLPGIALTIPKDGQPSPYLWNIR